MISRVQVGAIATGGLILLSILACAALLAWDWNTPYGRGEKAVVLSIPKGMDAGRVLEEVSGKGLVRSRISFKLAFAVLGKSRRIKAGTYSFERPLSPVEIIRKLNMGEVMLTKVTVPEGLRRDEVARSLARSGLGEESAFLEEVGNPKPIASLDPKARDLEGYLFPETYLLDPALDERAVVDILVSEFSAWWLREGAPSGTHFTPREVVTLASLVEKETGDSGERGLIAGVFLNRLERGMPLQTDPSIIYGEIQAGVFKGFLTRKDWLFPSPYNTYQHKGLPPGPICSPGRAALDAVLHPVPSSYLYFVSRGDGTHAFSRTLREHNRWVRIYRRRSAGVR